MRRLRFVLILYAVVAGCQPKPEGDNRSASNELTEQLQRVLEGQAQEIIVREQAIGEAEFASILAAKRVSALELYHFEAANVVGIEQLGDLRRLRIEGFACDDAAAREISNLRQITLLNLPDATFTDAGLAAIATLPNLELLRFGSPQVTDQGLASLAEVKTLRFLHLINVPISDRGLEAFHGMPQLESFYIDGGRQTDEGIRRLLEANPSLHFHRDQLHLPGDSRADGH